MARLLAEELKRDPRLAALSWCLKLDETVGLLRLALLVEVPVPETSRLVPALLDSVTSDVECEAMAEKEAIRLITCEVSGILAMRPNAMGRSTEASQGRGRDRRGEER